MTPDPQFVDAQGVEPWSNSVCPQPLRA